MISLLVRQKRGDKIKSDLIKLKRFFEQETNHEKRCEIWGAVVRHQKEIRRREKVYKEFLAVKNGETTYKKYLSKQND